MKLLKEVASDVESNILTESINGQLSAKKYFIEGIFIQGDIVNGNGRRYPMDILDEEVGRYDNMLIKTNRAYGELGHPDVPTINLDRVSHMIRSLVREGNNFRGRAEVLDTPSGRIVKALIDAGASLGVSSRGVGSLKQEGSANVVQRDFRLMAAADIVADPSAPEAFVTAVMEDREWVWNNGLLKPVDIDDYKRIINESKGKILDKQIEIFTDFLSKI